MEIMDEDIPDKYDVIVIGSGLVESIYAAAAARVGKSVLHLDRNGYYSSEWAVFSWDNLQKWVERHTLQSSETPASAAAAGGRVGLTAQTGVTDEEKCSLKELPLSAQSLVQNFVQYFYMPENDETGKSEDAQASGKSPEAISPPADVVEEESLSLEAVGPVDPSGGLTAASSDFQKDDGAKDRVSDDDKEANWSTSVIASAEAAVEDNVVERTQSGSDGVDATSGSTSDLWTIAKFRKLSRRFNIDLAPKVLYSRGALVELLISSNISRYTEFRAVGQILTPLQGQLTPVPSSRADVFNARGVSVVEKRLLMKLLAFCAEFDQHPQQYEEFARRPFSEFLRSRRLTPALTHHVTHAIAMVTPSTPTDAALRSTQRFLRSLGRYGNTPFLWPMYGSGELPQCFCRMCAVFGGVYHLSRGADSLLVDYSSPSLLDGDSVTSSAGDSDRPCGDSNTTCGRCVGVVSAGRRLRCSRMLLEAAYWPSFASASPSTGDAPSGCDGVGVSRAILMADGPLYRPASEVEQVALVRVPPGLTTTPTPVTVVQLGEASAAVPRGLFVYHLTCEQHDTAETDLRPTAELLLRMAADHIEDSACPPRLLNAIYFNRRSPATATDLPQGLAICSGPDSTLCFETAVQEARALFCAHFPDAEFLPRAPDPDEIIFFDNEDEGGVSPKPCALTGGAHPLPDDSQTLPDDVIGKTDEVRIAEREEAVRSEIQPRDDSSDGVV